MLSQIPTTFHNSLMTERTFLFHYTCWFEHKLKFPFYSFTFYFFLVITLISNSFVTEVHIHWQKMAVADYQAVLQICWTRFLALQVHIKVHLIRGIKRPWRLNFSEDKGRTIPIATNHPFCSGFLFPWTVFWVVSIKQKSLTQNYSWENACHTVSLLPAISWEVGVILYLAPCLGVFFHSS